VTLEQFTQAQLEMVAASSLDEFLPTLWVLGPEKVDVKVLSDLPADDLSSAVEQWVEVAAKGSDCFYAFRKDARTLACVSLVGSGRHERLAVVVD
jgi:hypothetical protein